MVDKMQRFAEYLVFFILFFVTRIFFQILFRFSLYLCTVNLKKMTDMKNVKSLLSVVAVCVLAFVTSCVHEVTPDTCSALGYRVIGYGL